MSQFRRRLLMMMQNKQEIWRDVVLTGTSVVVANDTTNGQPVKIMPSGWTEQDSTTGAQMFDISRVNNIKGSLTNNQDGTLTVLGKYYAGNQILNEICPNLVAGNTYFLKFNTNGLQYINAGGVIWTAGTSTEVTQSMLDGTLFFYGNNNGDTVTISDIMLNEGSTALPYEPYTGDQPSPSPEYPQDIFNAGTYNEETGKYEYGLRLTGKNLWSRPQPEEWTYSSVQPGYSDFKIYVGKNEKITFSFEKKPELGSGIYCGIVLTNNGDIEQWLINNVDDSKNTKSATIISKEDFIWVRAYSQGIEALLNNFPDFQIEYGEKRTGQSVTLTSDRPLTKWDRLVYMDGQWQWEYGGIKIIVDEKNWEVYSTLGFRRQSILPENMNRRYGFCNTLSVDTKGIYKNNLVWLGVSNESIYVINPTLYDDSLDDKGLSNWINYLSENPLFIQTYTDSPTYVPLTESEQQALNALRTYYPTTVFSNDQNGFMQIEYKTKRNFGLLKPEGTTSIFNFGVKWSECNKIVLKASGVNSNSANMIFASEGKTIPYISFNGGLSPTFSGITGGYYEGYGPDVFNEKYFEISFRFESPLSEKNIINIWDKNWSKQIIYHEIMFYNGDTLLADFVPDITNSDRMLNKVDGTYITASELGVYQLVEV